MSERLLIVDDEPGVRDMLAIALARPGLVLTTCASAERALEEMARAGADVIVTDLTMSGMTGLELLRAVNSSQNPPEVILITAHGSKEVAIEAMRNGAFDYVAKPFAVDELRMIVGRALERRRLMREASRLRAELEHRSEARFGRLVGESPAIVRVCGLLERFKDTPATVLLVGESGTGKGVVARSLHEQGPRAGRDFIAVNCGAIPETLIEAELFGAIRGAYTGLDRDRPGLVRAAEGGTLFLDEIGEMPAMAQVRLLQVLQERVVRPVGAIKEVPVDVRIIAATNRVLEEEVEAGRFREDLFYRLNVVRIELPALRNRRQDIQLLARHFLDEMAGRYNRPYVTIQHEAMARLRSYHWPGNVRELSNVIERALLMSMSDEIALEDLGEPFVSLPEPSDHDQFILGPNGMDLDARLAEIEAIYIQQALERTGGNRTEAAKLLNVTFRSMRYRIKKMQGLDADEDITL